MRLAVSEASCVHEASCVYEASCVHEASCAHEATPMPMRLSVIRFSTMTPTQRSKMAPNSNIYSNLTYSVLGYMADRKRASATFYYSIQYSDHGEHHRSLWLNCDPNNPYFAHIDLHTSKFVQLRIFSKTYNTPII